MRSTQPLNWLLRLVSQQIILVLTIVFCIGVGIALSGMSRLSMHLIESQALQNATLSAKTINEARILYSNDVVNRAQTVEGITVTHDYTNLTGAIPNPATYTIELGSRISTKHLGSLVRLYSDYPFPNRQAEGGPQDVFEREALHYLREHPSQPFFRSESVQGRPSFRYAEAIVMEPSCIACHNSHPESPKRDWQVGEVRGVLEIVQPLGSFMAQTRKSLKGAFFGLAGVSVVGLGGLAFAIGRLRQTAKDLERRVRERTADLAQTNEDLEKRNELIQRIFGRYLSTEVVANLLDKPEQLKLGGERKTIAILTSDLRGFTALSERFSPEEVVQILNLYLKHMSETIANYQGTIDKFMGDGILVLFGAPTTRSDDSERAVVCAVAMQLAMAPVNEQMKAWGYPPLEMGIGINTGDVVVGNIGSETRADYSAIGSQVNLTYRIESYTTGGQVLISESTFHQVNSIVQINGKQKVQPKGVKQPISLYEVQGVGGQYNLFLPEEKDDFYIIPEPIGIKYTILEGKHVDENTFDGLLSQLSQRGAKIETNQRRKDDLPPVLSNIKLNLWLDDRNTYSDDIYAKVLSVRVENKGFDIRFTAQPPEVEVWLEKLYQEIADRPMD